MAGQSVGLCDKIATQTVAGRIYCDQPTNDVLSSSPLWHDNVLSAGKAGGIRSPLSVIGHSPGGRRLMKADLAAKKAAIYGNDLASAKKAVAELIATVEMDSCKENASPCSLQKQFGFSSKAEVIGVKAEMLTKQTDRDVVGGDEEDKENIFRGWNMDEMAEISDNFGVEMVDDTVEQLDKQARTLRRRSQLSTDSSEYESILQQLKLVRQRQAELEKLQAKLHSRLAHCQSASADEQPLNLKLNSACEVERVDQDTVLEPLDLRVQSAKQCDELTYKNTQRVILADITSAVVGNADPNDCFEVPDSPPAAAADAESSSPIEDAVEVDGIVPIGENLASDVGCTEHIQTDGDVVESSQLKSTPIRLSPADGSNNAHVGVLDQYLASLNVSDISEADERSPTTASMASPDTSSEFSNYQSYQRTLDASVRCLDPIAAVLMDGDEQVCCLC